MLEAIDQETGTVLLHFQGGAPQPLPDFAGPVHGLVRGFLTADDLEDGDDVGGLEKMGAADPVLVHHALAQDGDGQPRGIAGQNGVAWRYGVHLLEECLFGLEIFGDRFDDEIGIADRILDLGRRPHAPDNGLRRLTTQELVTLQVAGVAVDIFHRFVHRLLPAAHQYGFLAAHGQYQGDLATHEAAAHDGGFI